MLSNSRWEPNEPFFIKVVLKQKERRVQKDEGYEVDTKNNTNKETVVLKNQSI